MGFGRALQMLGLLLLPVGLYHGIEGSMAVELSLLGLGVLLFLAGRKLEPAR
jgi:hypothetical protein